MNRWCILQSAVDLTKFLSAIGIIYPTGVVPTRKVLCKALDHLGSWSIAGLAGCFSYEPKRLCMVPKVLPWRCFRASVWRAPDFHLRHVVHRASSYWFIVSLDFCIIFLTFIPLWWSRRQLRASREAGFRLPSRMTACSLARLNSFDFSDTDLTTKRRLRFGHEVLCTPCDGTFCDFVRISGLFEGGRKVWMAIWSFGSSVFVFIHSQRLLWYLLHFFATFLKNTDESSLTLFVCFSKAPRNLLLPRAWSQ